MKKTDETILGREWDTGIGLFNLKLMYQLTIYTVYIDYR